MNRCSDSNSDDGSPTNKNIENALRRAAFISRDVKSVTIGPNSSIDILNDELDSPKRPPSPEKKLESLKSIKKSEKSPPKRSISHLITTEEIHTMQDQYNNQVKKREIDIKVRKQMEERLQAENKHYAKIQAKIEAMRIEAERKHQQRVEELERKLQAALLQEEQEEREYKKMFQEKVENSRKVLEQQEMELREALKKYDDCFNSLENVFMKILQTCPTEMSPTLDEFKKNVNILKTKKSSAKLPGELKSICVALDETNKALLKMKELQIKSQKENEERLKAEEKLREEKRMQEEAKAARESAAAAAAQSQVQSLNTDYETDKVFIRYQQLLAAKVNNTRNLSSAKELESLRFRLKFTINNAINMLDRADRTKTVESYQKLKCLLSGQNLETERGPISIATHPEAADWTILRIAEKLINISEIKSDDVFVHASITIALWQDFPTFGEMILSNLFKECPFLVPLSPRLSPSKGDLVNMGYRKDSETGAFEQHKTYQARTSKIAGFMAAIWIAQGPSGRNIPHPFGIENGWKYLVNVLNFPPNVMCAHILDKILQICGSSLHLAYGNQFVKLVRTLHASYLPAITAAADSETKGLCSQLQITVEEFMKTTRFPEPKGRLPANYW